TSAAAAARAGNGAAHQPGHLPRRERHSAATAQTAGGTSAAGRRGLLSAAEHHNSGEHDKRPPPRASAAAAARTEPGAALQPRTLPAGAGEGARAERSTTPARSKPCPTRRPGARPEPTTALASPPLRGRTERFLNLASSHRQTRAEKRNGPLDGTSVSSTTPPPAPSPANYSFCSSQPCLTSERRGRAALYFVRAFGGSRGGNFCWKENPERGGEFR